MHSGVVNHYLPGRGVKVSFHIKWGRSKIQLGRRSSRPTEQLQQHRHQGDDSPAAWKPNVPQPCWSNLKRHTGLNTHTGRYTEEGGTGREQGSLYSDSEEWQQKRSIRGIHRIPWQWLAGHFISLVVSLVLFRGLIFSGLSFKRKDDERKKSHTEASETQLFRGTVHYTSPCLLC